MKRCQTNRMRQSKICYSELDAIAAVQRIRARGGFDEARAYKCAKCLCWHVTGGTNQDWWHGLRGEKEGEEV